MKINFNCPYCDGMGELTFEKTTRQFRNENYELYEAYYICSNCKKRFTTKDSDQYNLNQLQHQYRSAYNIPFPPQLISIREKYDLTYAQLSEILGFGINQYRLYEN